MTRETITSKRRAECRRIIYVILFANSLDCKTPAQIIAEVDAAYPFGERKHAPYRTWLAVRNEMLTARGLIQPKPTPDTVKNFWTKDKS